MGSFIVGSRYSGAGHPWNVREAAGGCAGQWGATTVQEELPVIDDAGSWKKDAWDTFDQ